MGYLYNSSPTDFLTADDDVTLLTNDGGEPPPPPPPPPSGLRYLVVSRGSLWRRMGRVLLACLGI